MGARVPLLSPSDLASIAKVQGKCVKVDLSQMSFAQFESLMKTLRVKGRHEFTGIGLNLDLHNATLRKCEHTVQDRSETRASKTRCTRGSFALSNSVFRHRPQLTHDLSLILSGILKRTDSVAFISLRSLDFDAPDLRVLCDAFFTCDTLRVVHFCNVPFGDAGFARVSRAFKKCGVVDLQCRKCGLTDKSAADLESLISYHVSIQSELRWHNSLSREQSCPVVCLQHLDLRDNDFTFITIREVFDSLLDLPLRTLDFRGNPGISAGLVATLAHEIPGTTIRTGISKPIKGPKPKPKLYASKSRPHSVAQDTERPHLRKDNIRLRKLVDHLEKGGEIVEIEPDLAIVGPRARELADYLVQLDEIFKQRNLAPRLLADDREVRPPPGPKKQVKKKKPVKKCA
jgi:hypothetical protein